MRDINLHLNVGEMVCLLGPNGAGKSSLLRTLTGLQPALDGVIYVQDKNLGQQSAAQLAKHLAVVLTERIDVGNLTVYDMVALGRYPYTNWLGHLSRDDQVIILSAMSQTRCAILADRNINELSDGERQRVMIARALAQMTPVLVLDEPTAFLDLPRRIEVIRLLYSLARETQRAVLVSTHELDLALRYADRLWLIDEIGQFIQGYPDELKSNGTLKRVFNLDAFV